MENPTFDAEIIGPGEMDLIGYRLLDCYHSERLVADVKSLAEKERYTGDESDQLLAIISKKQDRDLCDEFLASGTEEVSSS